MNFEGVNALSVRINDDCIFPLDVDFNLDFAADPEIYILANKSSKTLQRH